MPNLLDKARAFGDRAYKAYTRSGSPWPTAFKSVRDNALIGAAGGAVIGGAYNVAQGRDAMRGAKRGAFYGAIGGGIYGAKGTGLKSRALKGLGWDSPNTVAKKMANTNMAPAWYGGNPSKNPRFYPGNS